MKFVCRNCLYPIDVEEAEFELLSEGGDEILCPKCQAVIVGFFQVKPARQMTEVVRIRKPLPSRG